MMKTNKIRKFIQAGYYILSMILVAPLLTVYVVILGMYDVATDLIPDFIGSFTERLKKVIATLCAIMLYPIAVLMVAGYDIFWYVKYLIVYQIMNDFPMLEKMANIEIP